MKQTTLLLTLVVAVALATSGVAFFQAESAGEKMSTSARAFLASLDEEQQAIAQLDYDDEGRLRWHFIPREMIEYHLTGVQLRHMTEAQKKLAKSLLASCLSKVGYEKATKIMELEHILHALETKAGANRFTRESDFYYFTIFGKPGDTSPWGLSIEGHHLSLNFVVENNEITSSTPTFLAANPATVKNKVEGGLPIGTRVLADEEQLAFDLVNSLSDTQKKTAIIADKAPKEIRDAGTPQPPANEEVGVAYADLNESQQELARQLVASYANNLPAEVRAARFQAIGNAGPESVRFAWAGALEPGVGHYYRVQGPSFLIEFVNTQPDAAGNPANHIHCVWRDMQGDFAVALAGE